MKLFIWEGNNISEAYHNDGTLVVLANTVAEARQLVRKMRQEFKVLEENFKGQVRIKAELKFIKKYGIRNKGSFPCNESDFFDGEDQALDQKPTRIVEINIPKWVAFNGGGYD